MIRIPQYPPPAKYFSEVKKPGNSYLKRHPQPSASDFRKHAYWGAIHGSLYKLYGGVCAYCASWTPRTPSDRLDQTSVDHFIPKSVDPSIAYEWANFRLCRARLNANKAAQLIVDPFHIANGWFQLDFTTFLVLPDYALPPYIESSILDTIAVLCLNDNDYVNERTEVIRRYCLGKISIDDLKVAYPFIANEMLRTDFDHTLMSEMRAFFRNQDARL